MFVENYSMLLADRNVSVVAQYKEGSSHRKNISRRGENPTLSCCSRRAHLLSIGKFEELFKSPPVRALILKCTALPV